MLRFPYFRFCYVLVTTYPALHPGRLLFWSNIIMCIFVMIAVNKSERKPSLSDIHVNHPTTSYLYYGFSLLFPSLQTGGKHILYLFLNCLTSSMAGTKSRRETCILKRSFAQSSFIMYIYANDILDYSRSLHRSSSYCPLVSLSARLYAQSGSRQSP